MLSDSEFTATVVEKGRFLGASIAGVAAFEPLKQSPSHRIYAKIGMDPETRWQDAPEDALQHEVDWPPDAVSAVVIRSRLLSLRPVGHCQVVADTISTHSAALRLPDDDCCAIHTPQALRAANRRTWIDMPEKKPNPNLRPPANNNKFLRKLTTAKKEGVVL